MNDTDLAAWLLEHGGPAVRYRTATELLLGQPPNLARVEEDLLASPAVGAWLNRLAPPALPD